MLVGSLISSNKSPSQVRTDNPFRSELDHAVDRAALQYMSDSTSNGLNIGIIYKGKISSYHYCENVKVSGKLPSDDLYYNIGSIAKTSTGTLLAQGYTKDRKPQLYVNLEGYYIGPSMNGTMRDLIGYVKAQADERDPAIHFSHQLTLTGSNGFAIWLNWMYNTENGIHYFYHNGNTKLGFNSLCTIYIAQQLGLFIIANDVHNSQKIGQMQNIIFNAVNQ